MAINPKIITPINQLSSDDLNTIAGGGSLTKGGNTLTASEEALYLIPDDRIIKSSTAPTSSTKGYVGQMILITTTGSEALYICTMAGSAYTWKKITLS